MANANTQVNEFHLQVLNAQLACLDRDTVPEGTARLGSFYQNTLTRSTSRFGEKRPFSFGDKDDVLFHQAKMLASQA